VVVIIHVADADVDFSPQLRPDRLPVTLEDVAKVIFLLPELRDLLVVGCDLVINYIEKKGGTADHPGKRWEEYATLISVPRVPSELK
jgi:hypothetical protein